VVTGLNLFWRLNFVSLNSGTLLSINNFLTSLLIVSMSLGRRDLLPCSIELISFIEPVHLLMSV